MDSDLDQRQTDNDESRSRKKQTSLKGFLKPLLTESSDTSIDSSSAVGQELSSKSSVSATGILQPEDVATSSKEPSPDESTDTSCGMGPIGQVIPTEFLSAPKQQPTDKAFHSRKFGKRNRSFQASWFERFPWIHYCQYTDSVLCYLCMKAPLQGCPKKDDRFITTGFCNWKKGLGKFLEHENSSCHRIAIQETVLPNQCGDIGENLSSLHQREKQENRRMLIEILRGIRFLARQGLALRRDNEEDGNFIQLLKLQSQTDADMLKWLTKTTNKYTSKDIQNESLQIMALSVLRRIGADIKKEVWFTIMGDEVTDSSNKEQLVICIRWVNEELHAEESFIGLYQVENIKADTLVAVIKDTLVRLELPLSDARGQCYDGASNMCGAKSGVSTQITREAPKAVFTHCYGHTLQLAVSDTMKEVKAIRDVFDSIQEITKLIKFSPKRNAIFNRLKEDLAPETPGFRVLCPTRWTVCGNSLQSVLDNYEVLRSTWDECLDEKRLESDVKARIIGVKSQMETFPFFFGTKVGVLILKMTDNLSKTLQHTYMSASEGQEIAIGTLTTLRKMRSDSEWRLFWASVCRDAEILGLPEPSLPRKRRLPARYESGLAAPEFHDSPEAHYHRIWNEAFDCSAEGISNRFKQPGYKVLQSLELILANGTSGKAYDTDLSMAEAQYRGDFDPVLLQVQINAKCEDPEGNNMCQKLLKF